MVSALMPRALICSHTKSMNTGGKANGHIVHLASELGLRVWQATLNMVSVGSQPSVCSRQNEMSHSANVQNDESLC